ncbi:hypothetical protein AMECASPLE_033756 [Ameca splendens]|uniref:Uncharacterized protein n=1 Tax=Ameca splendens TaxID=208324 RepID=A0ABV0Y700_9TELE
MCIQGFFKQICNSECEEPQTCPPGPETDTEEIRAIDLQRPPQSTGTPGEPLPGLPQASQRRAGESPRRTTQLPQCRSPRKLQQQAHRPCWQPSTPEQVQQWTQRPETPRHIAPQAEARQSQGAQAPASSHRE